MHSRATQPYIHMYPFSPKPRSHPACHITLSRVPCLIQQILVGIHFKYSSVYKSISNSLTVPSPRLFPLVTISLFSKSAVVVVQSPSHIRLSATPWTAAHQISLSLTISWSCPSSCSLHRWCCPAIIPSWITALSWWRGLHNSMTLWAMPCRATQDRQLIAECFDKTWSTGGRNGKPPKYTWRENLTNCIKGRKAKSVDSLLINKIGESHGMSLLRLDFENTVLLSRIYFFLSPLPYLVFSSSQSPFLPSSLCLSLFLSLFALRESAALLWTQPCARDHRARMQHPQPTPTGDWRPAYSHMDLLRTSSSPLRPWDDFYQSWYLECSLMRHPEPEAPSWALGLLY